MQRLVRDKIPEILEKSGKKCTIRHFSEEEFKDALIIKLIYDVADFIKTDDIEEMAEIFEVIGCIMDCHNWTYDQIGQVQLDREKKEGAFWDRVCLISVEQE